MFEYTLKNPPPRPMCVSLWPPDLRLLLSLVRRIAYHVGKAPTLPKDDANGPDIIALTTAPFTPADPMPSLSTALPAPDDGQRSTTKRSLSLAWHGVEQLLKRIEPCLGGTPAKVPINMLNTIIDIGKVCSQLAESRCNG